MSTDTWVLLYTHLKDRPKEDQALPMLQRVASLVKPIMRKHGWKLPVLAEFFPESPNLVGLNINGGQKICLRLRPAHSPDTFYDEANLVGTMLHELTHNVHGPHDEKFYKHLASLEEEYDTLQRAGYAGEGFHSKGYRVGANVSHNLPPHLARFKSLEAAEKRRKLAMLMQGGGRLGGGGAGRQSKTPRELAAEAAEKRARDERSCGSGELALREADKAAKDSVEDSVIDLTSDGEDDSGSVLQDRLPSNSNTSTLSSNNSKKRASGISIPEPKPSTSELRHPRPPVPRLRGRSGPYTIPSAAIVSDSVELDWACPVCTLVNDTLALQCIVCFTNRPQDPAAGWNCLACGEVGVPHEFWTCRFCGNVKNESTFG